jgi:Ca2+-binding EF-hand superfamily protein
LDAATLPEVLTTVHAKSQVEAKEKGEEEEEKGEEGGDSESEDEAPKKKIGFRDRKIIEYENRIRNFSTPDKIFRYFATIKVVYNYEESAGGAAAEILMTPDDFLRALTPGLRQPENLGLDQYKKIELTSKDKDFKKLLSETLLEEKKKLEYGLRQDSIFYKLSTYGLITFSDFLFLLTVLSVSHRHFEIAFRMFDLNGDGNVDYEEFEKVQNAILQQTSIGQKLGNALKSSSSYRGVSSALAKYFFGEDLKQKLTIEKFLDFQAKLQKEMLTLEFDRKNPDPETGRISEEAFATLLIAYAGFPEKKKARMLKRVKKVYRKPKEGKNGKNGKKGEEVEAKPRPSPEDEGISLMDYLQFFHFLQNIADVDIALTFFNMAGAGIDKATLKHAAKTVANVELRDQLVDVIFTLFDEDLDGHLSNREFISVMKERLRRGLAKNKDTGFMKLVTAFYNAVKVDGFFL